MRGGPLGIFHRTLFNMMGILGRGELTLQGGKGHIKVYPSYEIRRLKDSEKSLK